MPHETFPRHTIDLEPSATPGQDDAEFKEQLEQFAHLLLDIFLSLPPEERAKYSKEKWE